ncbi:MAG: Crp/Fnr family transcriptional regulator [Eubacteriales bacterium]|nr:Crp/Fnr family transcriptional regulator [Eubacteriales bacterium]
MELKTYFPFWDKLSISDKEIMESFAKIKKVKKGEIIHNGTENCSDLLLITDGQLRAYIMSEEGKEITLYRMFERDMCLFSAACIVNSIEFDIIVEAALDSEIISIPAEVYKNIMEKYAAVALYTNEVMAAKFSDVMWLMDQVVNKKLDSRLAAFLIEESDINNTKELKLTHEKIARHLGSVREVITRMLKYFQTEELVKLNRGGIEIINRDGLEKIGEPSIR